MLILVWISLIIIGLFVRKSKPIAFLQIMYMSIVMGTCNQTADYETYKNIYLDVVNSSISDLISSSWLFKMIVFTIGKFTNFQIVLFSIFLIGMILIYKTIIYYTDNVSYVLSLYMIASFVIDSTQFKNFLAMSIWLYFTKYLYNLYTQKGNNVKNICLYLLGVFLAMSVHGVMALTALCLLVCVINLKKMMVVSMSIIILFVSIDWLKLIDIIIKYLRNFNNSFINLVLLKYQAYSLNLDIEKVLLRMKICVFFLFIIIGLYFITKLIKANGSYEENHTFLTFVLYMQLIVICMMPLLFFSLEFYRLQRNLLLITYIAVAKYMSGNIRKINIKNCVITLMVLCAAGFYLYIDAILWNFEAVFLTLFREI